MTSDMVAPSQYSSQSMPITSLQSCGELTVSDVEATAVSMYCNGEKRPSDLRRFQLLSSEGGMRLVQEVISWSEVAVAIFMCSQSLKLYLKSLSPAPPAITASDAGPPGREDDPFASKLRHIKLYLEEAIMRRYQQGLATYCLRGLLDCFALVVRAGILETSEFSHVAVDIIRGFGMKAQAPLVADSAAAQEDCSLPHLATTVVPNKLAVMLLDALVQTMGVVNERQPASEHRRITAHFKDHCLDEIFDVSMCLLMAFHHELSSGNGGPFSRDVALVDIVVKLARSVLSFDFIGLIGMDGGDVTEEPASMNYPGAWRRICLHSQFFPTLWELFTSISNAPVAAREALLRCINCLCCIRRSFFVTDEERRRWLGLVLDGTIHVMSNTSSWLQEPRLCAEFCRLLCRIKPNYQLNEFLEDGNYERWLAAVTDLTCSAFQNWSYTAPSLGYLCSFWSRLVGSQQYAKREKATHFDVAVPQVVDAFLRSREHMADVFFGSKVPQAPRLLLGEFGAENPLTDATADYLNQIDGVATLLRFSLQRMVGDLAAMFRNTANQYASAIAQRSAPDPAVEERLAWLAFLFGSLVKSQTTAPDEEFDADASIISSMFHLMELMMQRYSIQAATPMQATPCWVIGSGSPTEHLELGTLHFLHNFRNIYVGETSNQANKTLARLQDRLGFGSLTAHDMQGRLLEFILSKVISNLQAWSANMGGTQAGGGNGLGGEDGEGGSQTNVLGETLRLLRDLSCGFASGRQLLDLPILQRLLSPVGARDFNFLQHARLYRLRVRYRHTTTTLLFLENGVHQRQLMRYMSPFINVLDELRRRCDEAASLQRASSASSGYPLQQITAFLREPNVDDDVVGALCDLRGTATACIGRHNFHMFFEILFPKHFETIVAIASVATNERMFVQILRFAHEVCYNRCQRIRFEPPSAGGFQLFFFAADMAQRMGMRVLDWVRGALFEGVGQHALDLVQASQVLARLLEARVGAQFTNGGSATTTSFMVNDGYSWLVKGSQLIMAIGNCALSGAYCNFGVLALYNDTRLATLLSTLWKFLVVFPLEVLLSAPKLAKEYFSLAAEIFSSHLGFVESQCSVREVLCVLSVLEGGLQAIALPAAAVTAAYTAIGSLSKHLVEGRWATYYQNSIEGQPLPLCTFPTSFESVILHEDPQLILRWAVLTFENLLAETGSSLFRYAEALLPLTWHLRLATLGSGAAAASSDHQLFPHGLARLLARGSQNPDEAFRRWVELLMKLCDNIEESLERKSRDKFLQQLTTLKNTMKSGNW